MRALVILNPSSRDFEARQRWPAMEQRLAAHAEISVVETLPDPVETRARILAEHAEGYDRVVAIGGDGTVHLTVNVLAERMERHVPELAVIPFGTANDVAKSLGLPLDDFDRLADIAVGDHLRSVDLARLVAGTNGVSRTCHWIDSVTLGMDADVLEARGKYRELGGYLAYVAALAERSVEQHSLDARVTIDGRTLDTRVFNIIVNNVPIYAGELKMPGALADDGLLDVYLFNRREYASKLLSFAIKQVDVLRLGFHELLEDLTENQREHHGRSVRIRLASPRRVQVDGEVFGQADEIACDVVGRLSIAAP